MHAFILLSDLIWQIGQSSFCQELNRTCKFHLKGFTQDLSILISQQQHCQYS